MIDSCLSWVAIDSSYKDGLGLDYKLAPRSDFNETYEDPIRTMECHRKRSYKMYVIFILFAIIQSQIASNEVKDLPTPRIHRTTIRDPLQFTLNWNVLDSGLKDEPVLGYKVHVWETPYVPRYRYVEVDGKVIRIADSPRRRELRMQKAHYTNSTTVIEGADKTTYTQENIKINITYEVKVQCFTKFRDGPLSPRNSFTLH